MGLLLATLVLLSAQTSAPVSKFDKTNAWNWLEKQCALGPRVPGTAAHKACRDQILEETKKHCTNAHLQEFTHKWSRDGKTYTMWNVIGEQNWETAKTRVALFTHWDTRPTADQESDPDRAAKPIPGANDGASGTAVYLELMRLTKNAPKDLGILYVFVDGEDLGPDLNEMFLGADFYSKNTGDHKPDYGILIDMIGDKDLRVPVEPNSKKYSGRLVDALYEHARKIGLEKTFPYAWGPTIEDDHIPLNESGIPTIDLIDFSYVPWHTLSDTPDKCSADSLGKVGRLLESWLLNPVPWKLK